jgi:hypothetical protein
MIPQKLKGFIKDYAKELYADKQKNLEKIDKFLDKYDTS